MRTNLIIDGNYLLHKDVFILYDTKTLYSDLPVLMRNDLDRLTKMYAYDNIYFVSDSKMRWRQKYFEGYKQNRKKDDKIDWNFVYDEYDKLKEEVKSRPNFFSYEVDWTEGDDVIAYIVKESNKLGSSNVIMAADSDLHQLLKFDISQEYINIMYNYKLSDEKTYFPKNYQIFLTEMAKASTSNLFDMNDDNDLLEFLEYLDNRTKTVEVISEKSLFCKLISGDKKDNVPSVYITQTKTGKDRGIGIKGGETIYNLYKETNANNIDFDVNDFVNKAADVVYYSRKVTDDSHLDIIKENIKRNMVLLTLDEKYLPKEISDNMRNTVKIRY